MRYWIILWKSQWILQASSSQTIVLLPLNYLGGLSRSVNNFIVHFLYLCNPNNSRNITMVWALSKQCWVRAFVLSTSESGGRDGWSSPSGINRDSPMRIFEWQFLVIRDTIWWESAHRPLRYHLDSSFVECLGAKTSTGYLYSSLSECCGASFLSIGTAVNYCKREDSTTVASIFLMPVPPTPPPTHV